MADNSKRITAYNIKKKQPNVPMFGVTIDKVVSGNRTIYIAKGYTEDTLDKLSTPVSLVRAEQAFTDKVATKGLGWS